MVEKKCFGTFFYPPLFFEKEPNYKDSKRDYFILQLEGPFYEFPFGNNNIFINHFGFLFTDNDDRDYSAEILNSIFLSTSFLKYRVRKTYPEELMELMFDLTERQTKTGVVTPIIERGWLHHSADIREGYPKNILTTDEFKIILEFAEQILHSKFNVAIFTFYECYTEWTKAKYTSCFLFGWITIEIFFSKKLEEYFISKGVFQELIEKLNKEWTVYRKMQYLKKEGVITNADFTKYDGLRTIRNDIIHSEYRPTSNQAENCKNAANDTLWELFRMDNLNYSSYFNRMEALSPP